MKPHQWDTLISTVTDEAQELNQASKHPWTYQIDIIIEGVGKFITEDDSLAVDAGQGAVRFLDTYHNQHFYPTDRIIGVVTRREPRPKN